MLKHLAIRNYALIENLESDFYKGFSVMTGETGAGKSIILGALGLILGQRADLQSLKNKQEKCIVEGVFDSEKLNLKPFFDHNDLDFDPRVTILRREILPSGKSRAFINDTPVSLLKLKELATSFVDLHSQNSATLLQSASFQLNVVDSYCKHSEDLVEYRDLFNSYRQKLNVLNGLKEKEKLSGTEQDFFQFQYEELKNAKLLEGEKDEAEKELEVLNHAEEIKSRLFSAQQLVEGEHGLDSIYNKLRMELKSIKDYSEEFSGIYNRLESSYLEISDLINELARIDDRVDVSPQRADELNERLNIINHLEQKHRVTGIEELNRIKNEYAEKIGHFESLGGEIEEGEKQAQQMESELRKLAEGISKQRKTAIPQLEKKITEQIFLLGMPDATVKIKLEEKPELSENGIDKVTFLFNANKGGTLQEMSRIASGGELSRLMLAIKSQIAANNLISTIIFDEIDSGVSGEVAAKMADIMHELGTKIQVISITHLPQIAAKGLHHYFVSKQTDDQTTVTQIRKLSQEERVTEIAKMLSSSHISSSALQTAQELMKN